MSCALLFGAAPAAATSTIIIEDPLGPTLPNDTFSFLVRLEGSTAISGYQFDLLITPQPGALGSVVGNPLPMSNFYASENLFTQAGGGLHEGFDATFLATAIPGPGEDVLAEISVTASADARGDFLVSIGDETQLAIDGSHEEPYVPSQMTIHILPEPGCLGILSGLALVFLRRVRKTA
jgi:hypothetical protein